MKRTDKPILVFQTDFTYAEGAVSSMYGVVKTVDRGLEIFDGTHEIPKFDTWSASFRLYQSLPFWPKGTIYVSVVDPGVGTGRRACAARTADGHYVVTPDNGSLTHVKRFIGIEEVREIDETVNRFPGTRGTAVFDGRDVFGYTAARLASGIINFEGVGPAYPVEEIVMHEMPEPEIGEAGACGMIEIVDPNFGNVWSDIPTDRFIGAGFSYGGQVRVRVEHGEEILFDEEVMFGRSFGFAKEGEPILYNNELGRLALALNCGSFKERYGVGFGPGWRVKIERV